jgi:hypothetical protein
MILTLKTVTLLLCWLSTKHNSIDLAKKALSCKRIKENNQGRINTQSKIADVHDTKMNMGFNLRTQTD